MRKIYVAVTTLTGQVDAGCTSALVSNIFAMQNIATARLEFIAGSCYIQQARNNHAQAFLDSDCDSMIFVDSDLWFSEKAMYLLVASGRDVVGGTYPKKRGKLNDYPVSINTGENGVAVPDKQGLISAKMLPTGLLLIKRGVFEKIKIAHPEFEDSEGFWHFFQTGLQFERKRFMGEDPFFCRVCRDIGIEMWLEPHISFMHYGIDARTGCYHDYLLSLNPNQEIIKTQIVGVPE